MYFDSIHIDPQNFDEALQTLDTLHDSWFVNLDGLDIPLEVQYLLQLGEKFGLPINKYNKEKTLVEFIKQIESNIIVRHNNIINFVRNNFIPILNRLNNNFPSSNVTEKHILEWLSKTKKFINEHHNLLITNADKGNVTVFLDRNTYLSKMEDILSDRDTYEIIDRDPTKKLTQDLRALLVRWKGVKFIDDSTYRKLFMTDGNIPRAYGLIKIHKNGNPLRVIISSINSPLYYISLFLHNNIIQNSIPQASSYIKDSFHLVNKLNGIHFDLKYTLVSLDVVSFFTNIPHNLIDSINKRWDFGVSSRLPLLDSSVRSHFDDMIPQNSEKFWIGILHYKDSSGCVVFSEIAKFALRVLSLPFSNVFVERFSFMNAIKTKARNRMSIEILMTIMRVRIRFAQTNECCNQFVPNDRMYELFTSQMYVELKQVVTVYDDNEDGIDFDEALEIFPTEDDLIV
ncbi:hypothetical protein ALC62_01155 [Cyphomyrmex costatus]|uniref:Reverse transcriptase domain-containing protein n=1 Tax=Cyphomyrmex costatus TaxID=456900 RepID=A0A151IPH8_9HYME|nr:hypothetical protein ALC62_01155 [Cyphomyrmex costatus]